MAFYFGRNNLARTLLEKENYDQTFAAMDKTVWYKVDTARFVNDEMCSKFVQLNFDAETSAFLDYCYEISNSVCLQLFYNLATSFLKLFMNKTCVNGLLNRGLMFLFSLEHLSIILPEFTNSDQNVSVGSTPINRVALDLGAGDGSITEKFFHNFSTIYATETSNTMKRRLSEKNIKVLSTLNEWESPEYLFDTIFCLNLIDRHPKPLTLLKNLYKKLLNKEATYIVLAVVFPFNQFVEYPEQSIDGSNPIESILLQGRSFEEQATNFVTQILKPIGFTLVRWSRLPYLCEGDLYKTCYWLDDAIFVLSA